MEETVWDPTHVTALLDGKVYSARFVSITDILLIIQLQYITLLLFHFSRFDDFLTHNDAAYCFVCFKYSHLQTQVPKWRKLCATKLLSVSLRVHRVDLLCQSELSFFPHHCFFLINVTGYTLILYHEHGPYSNQNSGFLDRIMKLKHMRRCFRDRGWNHLRHSPQEGMRVSEGVYKYM